MFIKLQRNHISEIFSFHDISHSSTASCFFPHDIHQPTLHPEAGLAGEVRQLCRLPDRLRAWLRNPARMHGPWKALSGDFKEYVGDVFESSNIILWALAIFIWT